MQVTLSGAIVGGVGMVEAYWWPLADARPTPLGWVGGEGYYIDNVGMVFVVADYPRGEVGSMLRWVGNPKDRQVEIYGTAGRGIQQLYTAGQYWLATNTIGGAPVYDSWGEVYSGAYDSAGASLGGGYGGPFAMGIQADGSYCLSYVGPDTIYNLYWSDGTTWTLPSGYRFHFMNDDYVMCHDETTSVPNLAVFDRAGNQVTLSLCAAASKWPVQPIVIQNTLWLLYYYDSPGVGAGLVLHPYNDATKLYLVPNTTTAFGAHARIVGNKLVVAYGTGASENITDAQRHIIPLIPQSKANTTFTGYTSLATATGAITRSEFAYDTVRKRYGATFDTDADVRFRLYKSDQATVVSETVLTTTDNAEVISGIDELRCNWSSCTVGGTSADPCWLVTYTRGEFLLDRFVRSSKFAKIVRASDAGVLTVSTTITLSVNTNEWNDSEASPVWDGVGFVVPFSADDVTQGPIARYVRVLTDATVAHTYNLVTPLQAFGALAAPEVKLYPRGLAISTAGVLCSVGVAVWPETYAQLIWTQQFTIVGGNITPTSGTYSLVSANSQDLVSNPSVTWDGSNFIAVWEENGGASYSVIASGGLPTPARTFLATGAAEPRIHAVASVLPPVVVSWDATGLHLHDFATATPYQLLSPNDTGYRAHISSNTDDKRYVISSVTANGLAVVAVGSASTGVTPIPLTASPSLSRGTPPIPPITPTSTPTTPTTSTTPSTANATALLTNTRTFRQPTSVTPPPAILSLLGTFASTILSGTSGNMDEDPPSYNPKYPYNTVLHASESGHLIEADDTPGAERIHIYHRSGSHIEMRPDGGVKYKSTKKRQDITIGDHEIIVQGDYNITVDGGSRILVRNGEFVIEAQYGAAINVKGQFKLSADNIELKAKNNIHLNAPTLDLGGFPPGGRPMISLPAGVLPYPPVSPVSFIPRVNLGLAGSVGNVDLFRRMPNTASIVANPAGMTTLFKQHLKDASGEPMFSELTTQPTLIPLSNPKVYLATNTPERIRFRERQFDTPEDVDDVESYAAHVGICVEKGDYTAAQRELPGQIVASDDTLPSAEPRPRRAFVFGGGGTVTCTRESVTVVGVGTSFTEDVESGQTILVAESMGVVDVVQSDTTLLLREPWSAATVSGAVPFVFRLRPMKEYFQRYTYTRASALGASGLKLVDMLPNFTTPVLEVPRLVTTHLTGGGGGGGGTPPVPPPAPPRGGGTDPGEPGPPPQ